VLGEVASASVSVSAGSGWQWSVVGSPLSVVSGCGEQIRSLAREAECRRTATRTEVANERTEN
jgi:hypothetical protein